MQIALTKKLADALKIKPAPSDEGANPLFSWTANWTNTFDRRKEDMVVLINNATGFTVTLYGIKRNQLQRLDEKITAAIRHTLEAMNVNEDVIDEYLQRADCIIYAANHDRKLTAQLNRQCLNAARVIGNRIIYSHDTIKYEDTLGRIISDAPINYTKNFDEGYVPKERFLTMLTELTGKPVYHYRAFELLVTLDLEIYQATRRLIVPANLSFVRLHQVLQYVFQWKNCHLYDFSILDEQSDDLLVRLVASAEDCEYDEDAIMMTNHVLSEYLSPGKRMLYTYDMGDNWEHTIEVMRDVPDYAEESPRLLSAEGQTPPEDVGGVPGFLDFREIILHPEHPEHEEMEKWAGFWSPELSEWEKRPAVIPC